MDLQLSLNEQLMEQIFRLYAVLRRGPIAGGDGEKGGRPSAQRACLMTVLFYAAPLFRRRPDAVSSLAAAAILLLAVDPAQVETLGKLVAAGLVERRQSVRDKRIFNIFLTDEGRERLSELIEDRPDFAALFLSPLCDEEKQRLLELLGKLIGAAGPDSDERGEDYDEE